MRAWFRYLVLWLVQLWHLVQPWLWPSANHLRWRQCRAITPARRVRAHPKPQWVRKEIIRLKALMPEAGCRTITHHFNRRFAVRRRMTVGKTYVADTIRRQQYAILCIRRTLKHRIPRPIPRNLIWGMDLLTKTDTHGRQHVVLAILDHASRACLQLQRLADKSSLRLLQQIVYAVKRFGHPRMVRTDNEAVFTSWRVRLVLRMLGIRHQRIEPGCPWQNGRVERLIGTVKRVLAPYAVEHAEQLDTLLHHTRRMYNHLRPHQHLHGRTPAEVWAGIDVFAPTRQSRRWLWRWERQWEQAVHSPG